MKRIIAGILTFTMALSLFACGTSPEQAKEKLLKKAETCFQEEKYQEVIDILGETGEDPDFQRWRDLAQSRLYYAEGDYAKVVETLKPYKERDEIYLEACEYVFDGSLEEAVSSFDADLAARAVFDYINETGEEETASEKLAVVLKEIAGQRNDDAFRFAESLTSACDKLSFYNRLTTILDLATLNRVTAFISGDWVRRDGSVNSGICLNVKVSENGNIIGTVTAVPEKNSFRQGNIKWTDFEIFDRENFTMYDLSSGGYYNYSSGSLDYDAYALNIVVNNNSMNYSYGASQYWFLEDYVKKFDNVEPITLDDFIIEQWDEETETIVFSDMTASLKRSKPDFFYADLEKNPDIAAAVKTARGVGLGATQDEVAAVYGIDQGKKYNKDSDAMRYYLRVKKMDSLFDLYDQQSYQWVYTEPKSKYCLVFCFDENHEVMMIITTPAATYWKNV